MGGMPGRPGKVDNSRYYDLLGEFLHLGSAASDVSNSRQDHSQKHCD